MVRLQDALTLGDTIKQALILGQGIYLPTGLGLTLVSWGTTTVSITQLFLNSDIYCNNTNMTAQLVVES